MKWIVEILEIRNYNVKTLWNDGVIREINLHEFLFEKSRNPYSSYYQLLDIEIFKQVKCDGTTLSWDNLIEYIDLDGTIKKGSLDIAPELLYEISDTKYNKAI